MGIGSEYEIPVEFMRKYTWAKKYESFLSPNYRLNSKSDRDIQPWLAASLEV